MGNPENKSRTHDRDMAAFTRDVSDAPQRAPLTQEQRDHDTYPRPLVKIVNYATDSKIQASLEQLNEHMGEFRKVILLIEDDGDASDACAEALHDLGYDGVQLITHVKEAVQHLEDIVANLTAAPAAIVLDLGLGYDSGFEVLRKCHSEVKLQQVPILVWTKHTDDLARTFSQYLGAQDFLIKSRDVKELREALRNLLSGKFEQNQFTRAC